MSLKNLFIHFIATIPENNHELNVFLIDPFSKWKCLPWDEDTKNRIKFAKKKF